MKTKNSLQTGLLLVFLSMFTGASFAQEHAHALASISYDFIHVTDTNHREHPRKESMILYMAEVGSVYKSRTLALKLAEMQKEMGEEFTSRNAKKQVFFNAPNVSSSELFLFPQKQEIAMVDKIGPTDYLISEVYPMINWKIKNQTRTIGGYNCQQAVGEFGGRTYIAWFTEEIPLPFGPWKLHGLPGLILQASDTSGEVQFNYAGFKKEQEQLFSIVLPAGAQRTTMDDFNKAKAAFEKNPLSNMRNMAPANANTKIVLKDQSGRQLSGDEARAMIESRAQEKKKQINNPLELDKK